MGAAAGDECAGELSGGYEVYNGGTEIFRGRSENPG